MHPRQSIIELFSTFLQFESERVSGWVTDAKLRRSMLRSMSQETQQNSESFWVLYWYNVWRSLDRILAKGHLTAYLQEPCYWTAQQVSASFASDRYSLSDFFQIAIAQVDLVLKSYNPTQGSTLKAYASTIFSSVIRNVLRQRQEVNICTDYALLRNLSQKRLVESLRQAGLSETTITSYVLAWNCFKTLYIPGQAKVTRQLLRPDRETWEAIANLYNTERQRLPTPTPPECSAQMLDKWLSYCAKAARAYLYPTFVSIDAPRGTEETGKFLEDLPDKTRESLIADFIAQEEAQNRLNQQAEINTVLTTALTELDSQSQTLLKLYYGQKLTQQQMAQQLDIKQYTISRRLTKARELLLLGLARWSQNKLHIYLSSDVIKNASTILEEWLLMQYSQPDLPVAVEQLYDVRSRSV